MWKDGFNFDDNGAITLEDDVYMDDNCNTYKLDSFGLYGFYGKVV